MSYEEWRRLSGNTEGTHLEMVTMLVTVLREMKMAGGEHADDGEATPYGQVRQALMFAIGQLVATGEGVELMNRVWSGDFVPDTEGSEPLRMGREHWHGVTTEERHVRVADLLAELHKEMNLAGGEAGPHVYAADSPLLPYGRVGAALRTTLVTLTGSLAHAERLDHLCQANGDGVAYNLAILRQEIEHARTVTVDVEADGTATVYGPTNHYFVGRIGRVGGSGLLWVTDDDAPDTVLGHAASHAEAGALLAQHRGVGHFATVKVVTRPPME